MVSIFKKSRHKVRYVFLSIKEIFYKVYLVFKRDGFFKGIKNGTSKVKRQIGKFINNIRKRDVNCGNTYDSILKSFSK